MVFKNARIFTNLLALQSLAESNFKDAYKDTIAQPTITGKIFVKNFRFHAKQCTKREVQYLDFSNFVGMI